MSNILQKITPSSIPMAIDASIIAYRSFLCTSSGGQLHQEPGVLWVESDLINAVLYTNLRQDLLPATIERLCHHYAPGDYGFQWFLGPSSQPQNYGDILLTHGLAHEEDEPGMAVDLHALNEDIPLAANITIVPVTDHALLAQWVRVWLFAVPEEIVNQFIANYASLPLSSTSPLQFYLGLVKGKPVATVCVFYDGCVAGIHYVVTRPELRGQGIGATMTLMAAREARAKGYRVAVLTASPFGINIYRRLGFREYCTFSTYEWRPDGNQVN